MSRPSADTDAACHAYRALLATLDDALVIVDDTGTVVALTPAAEALLDRAGCVDWPGRALPLIALSPTDGPPLARGRVAAIATVQGNEGRTLAVVCASHALDDGFRALRLGAAWATAPSGPRAFEADPQHIAKLLDACGIVPWRAYPERGYATEFAPSVETITGYPAEKFQRDPVSWMEAVHPEDMPMLQDAVARLEATGFYRLEFRIVTATGEVRWIESQAVLIEGGRSSERMISGFVRDISDRKAAEERIWYLAHHDQLTGLPNRAAMDTLIDHAVERTHRHGEGVALMFIDLDDFKHINDALGHHVGDAVLRLVGERIRGAVRSEDVVARLGGDEFIVLLEAPPGNPTQVARIAEKILAAIGGAMAVEDVELKVRASLGIALYPEGGVDRQSLQRNADAAMYRAKHNRDGGVAFYSPELTSRSRARLAMDSALRRALEAEDELALHYQPQIVLETGRVEGVEALLRWTTRDGRAVSPAEFIPLAEESGLIVPLGRWVFERAIRQASAWRATGMFAGTVSINVAARQLREARMVALLEDVLTRHIAQPGWFELELTENGLIGGDEQTLARIRRLREMGFALAVDDFGTGYSSLAYLKRFPLSRIKIDQSFVRGLPHNADDAAIVRAIIAVARALGLGIIAEGVELMTQAHFLAAQGCTALQGYLYARPMAPAAFEQWLAAQRRLPPGAFDTVAENDA